MTKAELVAKIAESAQLSKADIARVMNEFLTEIQDGLVTDGSFSLSGFGVFVVETSKERMGRNPRTGEAITLPARKRVKFKPYAALKDKIQ